MLVVASIHFLKLREITMIEATATASQVDDAAEPWNGGISLLDESNPCALINRVAEHMEAWRSIIEGHPEVLAMIGNSGYGASTICDSLRTLIAALRLAEDRVQAFERNRMTQGNISAFTTARVRTGDWPPRDAG